MTEKPTSKELERIISQLERKVLEYVCKENLGITEDRFISDPLNTDLASSLLLIWVWNAEIRR